MIGVRAALPQVTPLAEPLQGVARRAPQALTAHTAHAAHKAQLGVGEVRHARLRPTAHRFRYPTYFLMLPMRSLRRVPCKALARNRFGLISFHDADHGDGRDDSLAWLDGILAREGVIDAAGEVWLHCYPRVLGFTFKPVSFWYCHRSDGSLAAVLVEVNNTFGERHCYLLTGKQVAFGRELRTSKVFHVSPFCAVTGDYRFRFMCSGLEADAEAPDHPAAPAARPRTVACIDHHDEHGLLIHTSVSGRLQPITAARLRAAFFGMPLMTWGVIVRIHWQAARLFVKRVPFFRKPEAPRAFVSR